MRKLLLALLVGCFGCSTVGVEEATPGVVLECRSLDQCPTAELLAKYVEVFRSEAYLFDPSEPLLVRWFPKGTVLTFRTHEDGRVGRVVGQTLSPEEIEVTDERTLMHEMMHAHLWRLFPDFEGDVNHEAPPGPWTDETNAAVGRLADKATIVKGEE